MSLDLHIKLWEPSEEDWRVVIRFWSGLPPSDAALREPEQWKNATSSKVPSHALEIDESQLG
ncbi:hypothetical protein N7497_009889 [Penicillium chrysogenum]|nr:hypothetical protein N7497_009889 [Penicillium chrysogenum]